MEGANRGPYARLIRLSNGRYRRVVNPVVPKLFLKLGMCCSGENDTWDFDISTDQPLEQYEEPPNYNTVEYNGQTKSDLNESGYNGIHTHRETIDCGTKLYKLGTKETNPDQYNQEGYALQEKHVRIEIEREPTMVRRATKESEMDVSGPEEGTKSLQNQLNFEDQEGIPVLFYTKNREKPKLLTMVVDHDMQVIYMRRNKTSRFFPIKLIDNFVTSTKRIEYEFEKQIKSDPGIRVNNMVLFNASNFTDSVAIQFATESAKDQFIGEVNHIKDLIRKKF